MLKCPNKQCRAHNMASENSVFVVREYLQVHANRHFGNDGHYFVVSLPASKFYCILCDSNAIEVEIDDETGNSPQPV
jgi:hypothetical protein